MKYVLSFSDPEATEGERVGGKGYGLTWLKRNGFAVPSGWIVSVEGFDKFFAANQLSDTLEALEACSPTQFAPLAEEIRQGCSAGVFPAEILEELDKKLFSAPGFVDATFAVRSSALDEDGSLHSFAGQMDSVLNVTGTEKILAALRSCLASAFGERSLAYRVQRRLPLKIRMAAVIQQMAAAQVSGVAFTSDVVRGKRDTVVISANYGYGDGVVGGRCDCDEFRVASDGAVEAKIATKDKMSDGVSLLKVGPVARNKPCLSMNQARTLSAEVRRIASLRGAAQDVEWALTNGQFFILQTRPITRFAPDERNEKTFVFDNSNIQESYCGLTLPLTFSFASDAYYSVYSQVMRVMGFSEKTIQLHAHRHKSMLALIQGRVYYNINNWYEGLLCLPSFGRNKEDMEQMMGLSEPVDFVQDQKLSRWEKIVKLPFMLLLLGRLLFHFVRMGRLARNFEKWFEAEFNKIDRLAFHTLGTAALADKAVALKRVFLENWGIPIINDFYVMMMNGRVARKLKGLKLESQLPALIASDNVVSLEPTRFLLRVTERIRLHPQARSIFVTDGPENFMEKLQCVAPEIYKDLCRYIESYGDRCIGELKLESKSLREDRTFLHSILRGYLKKTDLDIVSFDRRQNFEKLKSENNVFMKVRDRYGYMSLLSFKKDLKRLRLAVRYRESMRLARTRVFGLFRSLYLELGQRFSQSGVLDSTRDIFFLSEEEIDQFVTGRSLQSSLVSLVALRKAEYAEFEKADVPHQMNLAFPMKKDFLERKPDLEGGDFLKGLGCFPGKVLSRAKLVRAPDGGLDLSGRILCALRTDPGWTPLFAGVDGLVVERGSTLSHSAVVAREMGLPAIVGVPGLMKTLRDDEWIEMDGAAGTLKRRPEEKTP